MIYIESTGGCQYMSKQQLAEEFHLSKSTVFSRMKEIEVEIRNGRYGPHAIIDDGNIVRINRLVFIDYMTYRRRLKEKNARKNVPPFNSAEVKHIIGWKDRIIKVEE